MEVPKFCTCSYFLRKTWRFCQIILFHHHNRSHCLVIFLFCNASNGCNNWIVFSFLCFLTLASCESLFGRILFSVENDPHNRFPGNISCWVDRIFNRVLLPSSLDQWPLQQMIIISRNCTIMAAWNCFYWLKFRWYARWWFLFRGI